MSRSRDLLLTVDGAINLVLGGALVGFPRDLVRFLGVPNVESAFYPSVLGGVLIGIGLALLLERFGRGGPTAGLGLAGAVVINLCGGLVLAGWLVLGELDLPTRGLVFLWGVVLALVGLSGFELVQQATAARPSAGVGAEG